MNEKVKCEKCGLLIDSDSEQCPYCGYKKEVKAEEKTLNNNQETDKQSENKENNHSEQPQRSYNIRDLDNMMGQGGNQTNSEPQNSSNLNNQRKFSFSKFESRTIQLKPWKQVLFFLIGCIGLTVFSLIIQKIIYQFNPYFLVSDAYSATINFVLYGLLFGILILIVFDNLIDIVHDFKIGRTWANGIMCAVILVALGVFVNIITSMISSAAGTTVTENNNQSSIESIVSVSPVLSIIIFGIVGPVCEEITYRLGLFSLLKRLNKVLAYAGTALIFGFIHFDWTCLSSGNGVLILNEFLNLPSYIVAGLWLCYTYDRFGIGASIVAHCGNNLYSLILSIFALMTNK